MTDRQKNIIITGLAASGKTTWAKFLNEKNKLGSELIVCDNIRFTNDKDWIRKPLFDYRNDILTAINRNSIAKIIEGAYFDPNDTEQARNTVFNELINNGYIKTVYCIEPDTLEGQMTRIIRRSINRSSGAEPKGTCPETPNTVAKLVIKNCINYNLNCEMLTKLKEVCIGRCEYVQLRQKDVELQCFN